MADLNNDQFALYYALSNLADVGTLAEEIKQHNYLDSTTVELCETIDKWINGVFAVAKDEAPTVYAEYVDTVGQAMAEADHP